MQVLRTHARLLISKQSKIKLLNLFPLTSDIMKHKDKKILLSSYYMAVEMFYLWAVLTVSL